MTDLETNQFSAKLDGMSAGPQTDAPVVRVRDVIVCSTDASTEVDTDEARAHPPIGSRLMLRETGSADSVDLGRSVRIDFLPHEEAELVMNACSPRGHHFVPVRQFGQQYSFIREVDPDSAVERPFRWDDEGTLWDALSLSRLVRDNGHSTEYAARITNYGDGEQRVMYALTAESKHAYRVRWDREWLDMEEGDELRALLAAYWEIPDLPLRVRRAMWRAEYASWIKWADLIVPVLVGGLEALLKTERNHSTRQFVARVPALAAEVGAPDVTGEFCDRLYGARSEWVHGAHVTLLATGQTAAEEARRGEEGDLSGEQRRAVFGDIARLQDVLRAAVRRCVEDDGFRSAFETDERVRERWPCSL